MSRIKRHKLSRSEQAAARAPEKKKMSKQMLWTIILGGVMLLSTFGIMFSSYNQGTEKVKYGEYTFKRSSTGWTAEINKQKIQFSYLPADLENVNVSSEVSEKLLGSKVIYITFNPNTKHVADLELMRFELANSLSQLFGIYAMAGITENSTLYKQPIVSCENATATTPVVSIVEADKTDTRVEGDCMVLETDQYSVMALKDKLLYNMLGIKQE
jgi:hypothetical protein